MKFARMFLRLTLMTMYFFVCASIWAQNTPAPAAQPQGQAVTPKSPYDSTKAQLAVTKEENLQLKANAATVQYQQAMKDMGAEYKTQEDAIAAWVEQVRKDNGWDASYQYDRVKDQWNHIPKREEKPADKPAEPAKK